MKIVFLSIFFTIYTCKLSIDDNPMNLVDDEFIYSSPQRGTFHWGLFQDKIEKLSQHFLDCIMKNGLKKESFYNCVGKDYSKVKYKMVENLQDAEASLKIEFARKLRTLCKGDNVVLCTDLTDELNKSFYEFKNPVTMITQKGNEFNKLNEKDQRNLELLIEDLKKNYKIYETSTFYVNKMENAAVRKIRKFIRDIGIELDYDWDKNPFVEKISSSTQNQ